MSRLIINRPRVYQEKRSRERRQLTESEGDRQTRREKLQLRKENGIKSLNILQEINYSTYYKSTNLVLLPISITHQDETLTFTDCLRCYSARHLCCSNRSSEGRPWGKFHLSLSIRLYSFFTFKFRLDNLVWYLLNVVTFVTFFWLKFADFFLSPERRKNNYKIW